MINAESREIIESKSINVEGKASGFKGVQIMGLNMAGKTDNKAVADACEKGIIQAIEFIASSRDKMPLPQANNAIVKTVASRSGQMESATSITEISVLSADYARMKPLLELLATKGSIMEKHVSGGTGYIKLEHKNTIDLAELIDAKLASKFSIDEFGNGKLTLKAK